jgi:RHS repeat-associated protein
VPALIETAKDVWRADRTEIDGHTVTRYRPRVEGLFARIERWRRKSDGDTHWRSISKDDVTTFYGKTGESRVFDPADPRRVFSWRICESRDDKGNAVLYSYAAEDDAGIDRGQANERNRVRTADRYLKRIRYGNRVSHRVQPDLEKAEWLFEVVFDYDEGHYKTLDPDPDRPAAEQHQRVRASASPARPWSMRPDPFSNHRAGFEVRTCRRCRRVLMFHNFSELGSRPCLVRATEFDYADLDYTRPVAVETELAHPGSTRFASFLRAATQSGFVRDETGPDLYLQKSLPPLEFEYSRAEIQDDVRELDADSLENLPIGLDGAAYRWVDLDGEGISGILTEQAGAWYYKPNRGDGRFGPLETLAARPSLADLHGGRQQLLDLAGDGQLDLVAFSGPTPGFYERTQDRGWEPFTTFDHLPDIPWDDPNLRFVDLDGDGHADVLITEHEVFTWYPSLAEEGFGPAEKVPKPTDEELGPRLVMADGEQSIYLADMCGDGLTDLVRIRNGEVCYWPNQGYGRFGAKVTMDGAPWLDHPDQLNQQRVRLADVDGSGTTDILYLGRDGVRIYFNQSGNRWSGPRRLSPFPHLDNLSAVMTADLLGNGTACLVWSSPLPGDARRPLRYIDLMGGRKPHLLVRSINNLGAETRVEYAASTKFYLADKHAGNPWITRLPFPVHVVERVETRDRVSGNLFVSRHAYHHGYFDGVERELRGFGLVEQWDTEEISALAAGGTLPDGTSFDAASHVPPVRTRTWFHTGIHRGREHVSDFFLGEYYREPGLTDAQARELLLDDTPLPGGLTLEEEREACRALKGSMLRQEVHALDGTAREAHPYTVTEQSFTLRRLQPKAGNRHAVFLAHPRESILYHYERDPADPRIAHTLTLEVDAFGGVLKSATAGYGRRQDDPGLPEDSDRDQQRQRLVTYLENDFTKPVETDDAHRAPLPCESRTYELTGYSPSGPAGRFQASDFVAPDPEGVLHPIFDEEISYEKNPTAGRQRRLIEHVRTLYRADDLTGPLKRGEMHALALPFEAYKRAFTPGLLATAHGGRTTDALLLEGGYVHSEDDSNWWIPSGRIFHSPDPSHTPAQELDHARNHFFLPCRYRDPFHTSAVSTETFVGYDAYDLLLQETRDALGNRVTAGERDADPTQPLVKSGQDYRALQPVLVMDPNRNRSAVAFDALGLVAGTAAMGKPEDKPVPGDQLTAAFRADLTQAEIDRFFADPRGTTAATLLGEATTRVVYDVTRYWRETDRGKKPPAFAATLVRETHASEPPPPGGLTIQVSLSYSDGFGREIQKKIQAEPGPVPERDAEGKIILGPDGLPVMTTTDVSPRWVGSGWTVFDNKGKPVRQYEPFFTDLHRFEFDVRIGVSPVLFYDPAGRGVATLHPDHTWEKVVFDAWRQATWDGNDTVQVNDPRTDPDAGGFFRRLPEAEYLPTWYARRQGGDLGPQEQKAAEKAAVHSGTPTLAHFDPLGRAFLTLAHNKFKLGTDPLVEERHATRVLFDIEGNQREVRDANGHAVMRYDYDMLGHRIHQASMEAGERWTLNDVTGKPLYAWDSRDHRFHTTYDPLRRPTGTLLRQGTGPEMLVGRIVYGESRPDPEASNLRGKTFEVSDQAGVVTTDSYDFKGNLLRGRRQLAQDYKTTLDWSATVALEATAYVTRTRYDALNRPVELTTPDNSVLRHAYNEANLLEKVEANLRGAAVATPFVTNIDYDAKGQRTRIDHGNDVRTTYEYDPLTFRLVHLKTRRNAAGFDGTDRPGEVQSLHYTYDPAGNIAHLRDDAQQTVYFRNRRVEPSAEYTYDAVYRLIEATGREHLGQTAGTPNPPTLPDALNGFHTRLDHPGDGDAMGTYVEQYVYDAVGNILSMQHRGSGPSNPGWKREYTYATNNQVASTSVGTTTETYRYDAHGNTTAMPHLPLMQWDFHDQLQASSRQSVTGSAIPETTWYVYDAAGQRVRKVTESAVTDADARAGKKPIRMEERIDLAGFEIHRKYESDGTTINLERETLHVLDDKRRVALIETRTAGTDPAPSQQIRYQHANHLGSASLELDQDAQILSYEEHFPYGATSYQAVRAKTEAPKRYRYTGRERDEESGLYYCTARYFVPWLGRWSSADPSGMQDGVNLYAYARNNPAVFNDPEGRKGRKENEQSSQIVFDDSEDRKGRKENGPPDDVTVNPQSEITTSEWREMLQRQIKTLPEELSKQVELAKKSGQWELTSGRLVIEVDAKGVRSQTLEAHIGEEEEYGRLPKMIRNVDLHLEPGYGKETPPGTKRPDRGHVMGYTRPSEALSDREPGTEAARLASKRGLIIVATEIIVRSAGSPGRGQKYDVFPAIKVPKELLPKYSVHEMALHAARFSQHLDASHDDPQVKQLWDRVDKVFGREARKIEEKFMTKVDELIEHMKSYQKKKSLP